MADGSEECEWELMLILTLPGRADTYSLELTKLVTTRVILGHCQSRTGVNQEAKVLQISFVFKYKLYKLP